MDAANAVLAIPQGDELDVMAGFIIVLPGFIGMYAHWFIARKKGHVTGRFIDYLIADNPQGTGITIALFFSALGGLNWLGLFDQVSTEYIVTAAKNLCIYKPALLAIITSFTIGFTFDSSLNNGAKQVSL